MKLKDLRAMPSKEAKEYVINSSQEDKLKLIAEIKGTVPKEEMDRLEALASLTSIAGEAYKKDDTALFVKMVKGIAVLTMVDTLDAHLAQGKTAIEFIDWMRSESAAILSAFVAASEECSE